MQADILISYFVRRNDARDALRELKKSGFRRAALVHKTADGDVHTQDPFLLRRTLGVTMAAILFGGFAGAASNILHWPASILSEPLSTLASILVGGLVGTIFSAVWIRRSKYGVERKLLESHARWLVSDETVLILQAPIEKLQLPAAVLREIGEIPPAVFVLHPKREGQIGDVQNVGEPFSPTQIRKHAELLAKDHQVDPERQQNTWLL